MQQHEIISFLISVAIGLVVIFLFIKTFFNLYLSYRTTKQTNESFYTIEKIRPFVFIKLFANCLTLSFFPQYILKLVVSSHLPTTISAYIYVIYQVFFVLMLIPGGYLVEVKNIKALLIITTIIESLLMIAFGITHSVFIVIVIQIIFGCMVPISSSAEYGYILSLSTQENRSYAISLYSNSLKAAMVAGVVVGGWLASFGGERMVFFIAGFLIFLAMIYALWLIPNIRFAAINANARRGNYSFRFVLNHMPKVFKNLEFIKTLFCVGCSLGFLNDGIILFSMPILLSHYHFSHQFIGEIIMFFSIGFFISNKTIAKKSDRFKNERFFLVIGFLGISICLILLSTIQLFSGFKQMLFLILIILGLGIFRGFLFSPGTAYAIKNPITNQIGKNVVLSLFRLFQAFGSIIGPILLGYFLINSNYKPLVFLVISFVFMLLSALLMSKNFKISCGS